MCIIQCASLKRMMHTPPQVSCLSFLSSFSSSSLSLVSSLSCPPSHAVSLLHRVHHSRDHVSRASFKRHVPRDMCINCASHEHHISLSQVSCLFFSLGWSPSLSLVLLSLASLALVSFSLFSLLLSRFSFCRQSLLSPSLPSLVSLSLSPFHLLSHSSLFTSLDWRALSLSLSLPPSLPRLAFTRYSFYV